MNFKLLCNLGTGNSQDTGVFMNNIERTGATGIRPENTTYKGSRINSRAPAIGNANTENAYEFRMYGANSSTATGEVDIDYDGNVFANNVPTPSDINFKENIVDANLTNLISDFQKIRFVNFNLIDDYKKLKRLGVIAQELQQIYPTAIIEKNRTDDDGNDIGTKLYVKYEVLYLKSCLLVQHLLKENEALKTRLTNLESQVNLNNAMLTNLTIMLCYNIWTKKI